MDLKKCKTAEGNPSAVSHYWLSVGLVQYSAGYDDQQNKQDQDYTSRGKTSMHSGHANSSLNNISGTALLRSRRWFSALGIQYCMNSRPWGLDKCPCCLTIGQLSDLEPQQLGMLVRKTADRERRLSI